MEEQIKKVVTWLKEQVTAARAAGLVVGLSGGVDSALVGYLIKQACPTASLGVILPCHSQITDQEDALAVAQAIGLEYMTINLAQAHTLLLTEVKNRVGRVDSERIRMVDANLRARLRMATLYGIANMYNYLVVGTDNAAETYTGYFTKYGDGGVDLQPIACLTKRQVRAWAQAVGIPEVVINKPPSAGLWPGQTDEAEMGVTYELIDDFLEGKAIPNDARQVLETLHRRSAHKRQLPPICPL